MLEFQALQIWGRWEGPEKKRRSRKLRKEVGFETKEAGTVALEVHCRTGLCCWCAESLWEEGLHSFSASSVSMAPKVVAFEAGGLQQLLWAGDEIRMGEEEEGRAQSHLGEVGSSREMSRCAVVGKEVVEVVGMGTQGAVGAVQSVTPGEPKADWPS